MAETARRKRDVTVADVARRAGVGKATASRALGGYGQVSEANRLKVLTAAEALGYRPNELARSMNTGRSKTLGVIVGDIENNYFGLATRGISDVARAAGYDVILINTSENLDNEVDAVRVLLDKRVDAVILSPVSAYASDHLREVTASGRPLVMLDRHVDGLDAPAIEVDIASAAGDATRLLIDAGHRRIAFVSALQTDGTHFKGFPLGISSVAQRLGGIIDAKRRAGVEVTPDLYRFQAHGFSETHRVVNELLDDTSPPTALIVSDSSITLNVLRVLRERGVDIPRDISLIAFDDMSWTAFTAPPLTVVAQPIYEVGSTAARTALQMIGVDLPALSARDTLQATLVPRDSVAPPRSGSREQKMMPISPSA